MIQKQACGQPAVGFGCWSRSQAVEYVFQPSDNSSSNKLSEVVVSSLPAEEEIASVMKHRPSLPAKECLSVKRQHCFAEGREREGKKITKE
ncbi:hypothetical protein BDR04DRAFT_1101932 [Suillus decipiens]|nr:hypothetical protein BDR04DRAFT_1101932 [Suillus decipiens]